MSSSHAEVQVSAALPVCIVVGHDVDASVMPLAFQRNRVVVDMLRCYSCASFVVSNKQAEDSNVVQRSDIFEWFLDPFPVVGVDDMKGFHAESYVHYLSIRETLSDLDDFTSAATRIRAEEIQPFISRGTSVRLPSLPRCFVALCPIDSDNDYNLTGDNVPFLGMWKTIQATLSGTLTAVRLLARSGCFFALHWFGGRGRAHANAAAGFTFVNDVVLGVCEMQRLLPLSKNHIIVVNVGSCHGDGTQEAFLHDNSVLTLSMHAYGVGVLPGTGGMEEIGVGLGRGFTINVPLPVGATDNIAVPLMMRAISFALRKMDERLGAIVIVCDSDALSGDPLGYLNLTVGGLQCIVRALLREAVCRSLKVLILGAGGHADVSCARLAGVVTKDVLSCAAVMRLGGVDYFSQSADVSRDLGVAVPEDCEYFARYGPSFLMHGLPPPRVVKVRMLPQDSPLYPRIRKVAETRALRMLERDNAAKEEEGLYNSDDEEEEEETDEEEEETDEEEEETDEEEEGIDGEEEDTVDKAEETESSISEDEEGEKEEDIEEW